MTRLLKIGELAEKAGVERSTIQHYRREGLLPEPTLQPHYNVAYYSSDTVERIKLIRELQSTRHLPLSRIRQLLDDAPSVDRIRQWMKDNPADAHAEPARPMSRAALMRETGLGKAQLEHLEEMGFLTPTRQGRALRYSEEDVAVARAISAMRDAGLNEAQGFGLEAMPMYMQAMQGLIARELALFSSQLGTLPREQMIGLAESGLRGTSALLLALRRKLLVDLLKGGDAHSSQENAGAHEKSSRGGGNHVAPKRKALAGGATGRATARARKKTTSKGGARRRATTPGNRGGNR